jgi:hypothetical protein
MKWLIGLMALLFVISPAFAGIVNVAPNPSFETTRVDNASLPLSWYICQPENLFCSSDEMAWGQTALSSDFFIEGSKSFMLVCDYEIGDNGFSIVGTAANETSLPIGLYNFSFYWKVNSTNYAALDFTIMNSSYDSFRWFIRMSTYLGVYDGDFSQCYGVNGVPDMDCNVESVGDGWYKTSMTINSTKVLKPQYSIYTIDIETAAPTKTYVDNISLSYFTEDLDTTPPVVTIALPTGVYDTGTTSVPLNFTAVDDTAVDSCWYVLNNGANTTITSCANTTLNVSAGDYNITVYANDTSSNIGSNSTSFSVNASVVPPITGKITGATANIVLFLPLLFGIGLIVLVARRIEDMNSIEDFVGVIIGLGIGIAMLGVFVAIIVGLI